MIRTLPLGLGNLDFSDWSRGLVAAFISGGASAVTSGITVNLLDPGHYNVHTGSFYVLVGAMFAANGTMNMMAFLRTKPIPDLKTVETTVHTVKQAGVPPRVETIVKETTVEPVAKSNGETPKDKG